MAQTTAAQAEASVEPTDLRAELGSDLKYKFAANLSEETTLPLAVSNALVALLAASDPISADIMTALSLEDPTPPEAANE